MKKSKGKKHVGRTRPRRNNSKSNRAVSSRKTGSKTSKRTRGSSSTKNKNFAKHTKEPGKRKSTKRSKADREQEALDKMLLNILKKSAKKRKREELWEEYDLEDYIGDSEDEGSP